MTKDIPEIRFNGFIGSWQPSKLEDVAQFHDERRKPITESVREPGPYPYYGASGIIDYVKDFIFDEEMILLSEDGANIIDRNYRVCFLATGQYWVNNHAHVLKAKQGNNNLFLCESLERLCYDKYNTGTAQPKINQDVCRNLPIYVTDIDEQEKLGNYFQKLDTLINQHQQKHDKLSNLKKAMLEKMFPKAGETVPEIRFDGFSGEWESKEIRELADIVRGASPRPIDDPKWFDKSSKVGWLRIRDVTEQDGRIHHLEQRISKEGESKTRVLHESHLLLSIAASVGKPVINYVSTGVHDGFLIFRQPNFDMEFMYQWLKSFESKWQQYGQPGSQVNLNSDIVKNQVVLVPCRDEQILIGDYFKKLDRLINQHKQQITKLKNIKQACLDKMFV